MCMSKSEPADDDGSVELMAAYASPIPVTVIARILGIPDEHTGEFRTWADDFFILRGGMGIPIDEQIERWSRLLDEEDFVRAYIAQRRAEGRLVARRHADPVDQRRALAGLAGQQTLQPLHLGAERAGLALGLGPRRPRRALFLLRRGPRRLPRASASRRYPRRPPTCLQAAIPGHGFRRGRRPPATQAAV